jgi:hypothetical protein
LKLTEHHARQCRKQVTQLVNIAENDIDVALENQGSNKNPAGARKIGPGTRFDTCQERLSPFGGLWGLIKFLDLFRFEAIFEKLYLPPSRKPLLGHYKMMLAIIMLLFIGFARLWHFLYVQLDPMLCATLGVEQLPHATTFWRYLDSLGINQAQPLLKIAAAVRERVWAHCGLAFKTIHIDIDTTVETVYGDHQGARKGHNTKHRGKKGFRPVMAFISETKEFLAGKFRKGATITAEETARLIRSFPQYLPGVVKEVVIRADGEFFAHESVSAARKCGYSFIIANRAGKPGFDNASWYKVNPKDTISYNDCTYQPQGWDKPERFVAMRIPIEEAEDASQSEKQQLPLFEDDRYKYRIFVTDRKHKAHKAIEEYDGRADAENLVGEVKREGLSAIPSAKFKNNYAFFYIVMLAYNIWRWMKLVAAMTAPQEVEDESRHPLSAIAQSTLRIARLVLSLIAAKIVYSANRVKVRYSIHDTRVAAFFDYLHHLDHHRGLPFAAPSWRPNCQPPDLPMQEISCTDSSAATVRKVKKDKT